MRLTDDALAGGRHGHLVGAPLEDLRAEFLFELLDRNRQGGLADEAGLRGTAEMPLAGDGDDIAEFGQCHAVGFTR